MLIAIAKAQVQSQMHRETHNQLLITIAGD